MDYANQYAKARMYIKDSNYDEAYLILSQIVDKYKVLEEYITYDLALCLERLGRTEESIEKFKAIIKNYKNSYLRIKSYKQLLKIYSSHKQKKLEILDEYLKEMPNDRDMLYEKALLLKGFGQKGESQVIFKRLLFSGDILALKAYEELNLSQKNISKEDVEQAISRLLENNNCDEALELLKRIDFHFLKKNYFYGLANFKKRQYKTATEFLKNEKTSEGFKLLALSLMRSKEYESFFKLVDNLIEGQKKDIYNVVFAAAELKRRLGEFELANKYFAYLLNNYPDKGEDINFGIAWLNIRNRQYGVAKNILENLIKTETNSKDKYLFWLGKINEYEGMDGSNYFNAMTDKEGYYYLRRLPYEKISYSMDSKNLQVDVDISKIKELLKLNMRDEAVNELKDRYNELLDKNPDFLALLLINLEDYNGLVKLGIQKNIHLYKYPFPYEDIILENAIRYNVDPFLIVSVMREESHFNKNIISSAGAIGLMQLMPVTAKKVANVDSINELFHIKINIATGTKYLSELLKKYKRYEYAIAAYNAGENVLEQWLKESYKDIDEFVEDIPYKETRNYVKKVMRTYSIMMSLYPMLNEKVAFK